MSSRLMLGVFLLAAGAVLLVVGLNVSPALSGQVENVLSGRFAQTATWYTIGGTAAALVGLLLVLFGTRRDGLA